MNNAIYKFKSIMDDYKLNLVCPFVQVGKLNKELCVQRFYIKQFLESFGEEYKENKKNFICSIADLISNGCDGHIIYWDDYDKMCIASEKDDILYRIQETINKNKEFCTIYISHTQIKSFLQGVISRAFDYFFYGNQYLRKSLRQQIEKILIEDTNCSDLYFDMPILTIFLGDKNTNHKELKETYLKEAFDTFRELKMISHKALNKNIYNIDFYIGFGTYNTIHISSWENNNILSHLFQNPKKITTNINCILCVLEDVIANAINMFIEELC